MAVANGQENGVYTFAHIKTEKVLEVCLAALSGDCSECASTDCPAAEEPGGCLLRLGK